MVAVMFQTLRPCTAIAPISGSGFPGSALTRSLEPTLDTGFCLSFDVCSWLVAMP
jgi:hypothetical protein